MIKNFGFLTYEQIIKLDPLAFSREHKEVDKTTIDVNATAEEKQKARILKHIDNSVSLAELNEVAGLISEYDLSEEYQSKFDTLNE